LSNNDKAPSLPVISKYYCVFCKVEFKAAANLRQHKSTNYHKENEFVVKLLELFLILILIIFVSRLNEATMYTIDNITISKKNFQNLHKKDALLSDTVSFGISIKLVIQ
jgi:hypothetical protein